MGGPDWLADTFAALMLLTAAYCVSRLLLAPRLHRVVETDVDLVHIAMGVVMAGMLVAALQFVPTSVSALVFGFATLWFARRAVQAFQRSDSGWTGSHHAVPHMILSGSMLYMVLAQPSSVTAMTSMTQAMGSTVKFAPLGAILAVVLIGYAVWYANRLAPTSTAESFELAGVGTSAPRGDPASLHRIHWTAPEAGMPTRAAAPTVANAATAASGPDGDGDEPFLAPRAAIGCHIVMCITMAYMLITMV